LAYKIVYKRSVLSDLKKLSKKEARNIIEQIEKHLSKKADSYPMLKGQFKGLRKYRVGNYRIIYVLLENDVLILRISHRKKVYK
jgi:mRNA interferase RelE/StbE